MFIYLRMITDNDTKKQIETTAEAYQYFFSGDINNSEGIVIDAEDEKKNKASFRISKGAGASNSYRFSSYNNGITLSNFLNNINGEKYKSGDIIKIIRKNETFQIYLITENSKEYESLKSLLIDKGNPSIIIDSPSTQPLQQTIYYGVPGSGKSHKIDEITKNLSEDQKIRVVFHPEYTNADFVGQILPCLTSDGIEYRFNYYLLDNSIEVTEDMDIGTMLDLLVDDYINNMILGYENNLRIILTDEGVSVSDEDDMDSLISKVDSEFDNQVVPAGTAVAANVDSGKTFINSTGQLVTGTSTKVSPAGTAVASNVLSGKTFINSTGSTVTGTMANRGGAQTVTPGTSNKTLNSGYYSGNITVKGDSNLVAENIVSGKSIFGVTGTAKTGSMQFATGSFDYGPDVTSITVTTNLDFTPQYIFVLIPASTTAGDSGQTGKNIVVSNLAEVSFIGNNEYKYSIKNISSTSFKFNCVDQYLMSNTITCNWYAFG